MGGALASIAAFEIRRLGKEHGRDKKITCITFGAPRTGNHAFAAEYNVRSVIPSAVLTFQIFKPANLICSQLRGCLVF